MRRLDSVKRYASAVLVLSCLVAAGLFVPGAREFWLRQPFATGVATGVITVAATLLLFERLAVARANRRWAHIPAVAYRGLARETREVFNTLAGLYCDLSHPLGTLMPGGAKGYRDIRPLDGLRETIPGKEKLAAFGVELPPQTPPDDDVVPEPRLRTLLQDRDWCALVAQELGRLVDSNRHAVAYWAPLTVPAEGSRDLLDSFSSLNDEMFVLAVAVRRIWDSGIMTGPSDETEVVMLWRVVDLKARVLTNVLWKLAAEGSYTIFVPAEVSAMSSSDVLSELFTIPGWDKLAGFHVRSDPYVP